MNIWISSKLNFMVIDLEFQKNIKISLNWRFCNFVETQNSIVENCVSTIFHYGILCFHNFPIIGSMVFCGNTIWHYGILCFHNFPLWNFVFPQSATNIDEPVDDKWGGNSRQFFFQNPFNSQVQKLTKPGFRWLAHLENLATVLIFSTRLIIILGYPFRNETGFFVLKSIPNMLKPL